MCLFGVLFFQLCHDCKSCISSLSKSFSNTNNSESSPLKSGDGWKLHWVPREQNLMASNLAVWIARTRVCGPPDLQELPLSVLHSDVVYFEPP